MPNAAVSSEDNSHQAFQKLQISSQKPLNPWSYLFLLSDNSTTSVPRDLPRILHHTAKAQAKHPQQTSFCSSLKITNNLLGFLFYFTQPVESTDGDTHTSHWRCLTPKGTPRAASPHIQLLSQTSSALSCSLSPEQQPSPCLSHSNPIPATIACFLSLPYGDHSKLIASGAGLPGLQELTGISSYIRI